jgi:fatty-acyl-CoA synthase
MTTSVDPTNLALWPRHATPADLSTIEAVPLSERGLPPTTYDLLTRAASLWPHKTAVTVMPQAARWREATNRTFGQLHADVVTAANALHGMGVQRTDAVALLSPNCDELITATLAAQVAGVAAPINAGLAPAHVAELIQRSGAKVLICAGPSLNETVWALAQDVARRAGIGHVLVLRPTDADTSGTHDLPHLPGILIEWFSDAAHGQRSDRFAGRPPAAQDIAALFHTGGTTGTPKLAAHTHANEVTDAWSIAVNSVLDEDSVIFAALPLFHVNALLVTVLAPLFRGQPTVWAGPDGYRDLELFSQLWRIIEHYEVAVISAVPTVYAVLARQPLDADVSSMKFALVGASPLPDGVRREFEAATNITLLEGYGLTEATCASVRAFPGATPPRSVGQRLPYQQIKAVRVEDDGTWTDLPPDEVGVLVISGPTVFPGYVQARDDLGYVLDGQGKLRDGWLDTGDLGHIDEDGFVYLVGRAKDLIIRGGHNLDPAVVEDSLLSHPDVSGVNAVGRPDAHAGEVPVAYVTLVAGATIDETDLAAWSRTHVPEPAAAPRHVHIVESLPVTLVGKPYKPALRADAARREMAEALAGCSGVTEVKADLEDGTVVISVELTTDDDLESVELILARYAVRSVIIRASGKPSTPR